MGNVRPLSSHGSRTRPTSTARGNLSLSLTRKHSHDISYKSSELAVRDLSNSPRHDRLQTRRSPEYEKDRADLESRTLWLTEPPDISHFQLNRTHARTESEQHRITHRNRSLLSDEASSTSDVEALDGGQSRTRSTRVSSKDMDGAQGSEESRRQISQTPETRLSSTFPWPEKVVQGLHNLHRHRTRLSFYGQTFREQYEYVKDERNQMANVVAILLQEVGRAPGLVLNNARIQTLGEDIARRHAALAQTEADLDTMKDRVAQTERALQAVEADLCSYIISDRNSNDTDAVGDLCGSMLSESFVTTDAASSIDHSEPKTDAIQAERMMKPQTSSLALYRLHLTSQYSGSPHLATSTAPILVDQPSLITDTELALKEAGTQPYWDLDLISITSGLQQQNVTPDLHWIGQHYWDRRELEQKQSNDSILDDLLAASPSQILKRQRDLARLLSQTDDIIRDAEECDSSSDLSLTADAKDQLLHIKRRSWLEFSRFATYFNKFAREAISLQALSFEVIDAMLERVIFVENDLDSQASLRSTSDVSSLSSIKLNILNDALPSNPEQLVSKRVESNSEIFARMTCPEVPTINPNSICETNDSDLLANPTTNESHAQIPRSSSLPADLSKPDLSMARYQTFPTL